VVLGRWRFGDAVEGGARALWDGILGDRKVRNGLLLWRAITFASDVIDIPPARTISHVEISMQIPLGDWNFVLVWVGTCR